MWNKFWAWYERHYKANLVIAAVLFVWQIVHLYWLSTYVIATKLIGKSFFNVTDNWELFLTLIDYTEVPAIIGTSLIYINNLRKKFAHKDLWFLIFINTQWLHIFWITDEFVLHGLGLESVSATILPFWLAWVAILIDYLELPVMYDTIKKAIKVVFNKTNRVDEKFSPDKLN